MGRKVGGKDTRDPLEVGREEVEATTGVLYRTGHETGGLDVEKRREKQRSAVGTPASMAIARRFLFTFFL